MNRNLVNAIANRDGAALARLSDSYQTNNQPVVNENAEKLVNKLFRQLKQVFPAATQTNLRNESDEALAKQQWIAAFAENGIRTKEQLSAGMRQARASESPFWPSPGQFVQWCKQGSIQNAGLPDESELYDMIMDYSAKRGSYSSAECYPWSSHACYWMVTKLYSQMMGLNLSESELRKRCKQELVSMSRRMESGEQIPEPKVQLIELHIPTSNERALNHLAEIRRKFNLKPHQKDF
ncbi:replication protein P [Xenorhabdus anantnagensis]|uniref:Replication protein P n=1 Tax=Xenorhabdus anantnagensis TaxID=3025875 RepID=A0ABT5LWQ6_9GAMM|nr:replication protein P [Xenorhabdus anantnagensis]MDC9598876.1 replication protein P [Xenorhabdus anantnagensis]